MIKTISTALAVSAVVTFVGVCGQASAQDCSSCAPSGNSFAYPAPVAQTSCAGGGCRLRHGHGHGHGGRVAEFRDRLGHQADINWKIAARNDAWPKPFACWEKRDYYHLWGVMLNAGVETNAVLDENYFTDENVLNRLGIDRVAGVVLNMPTDERTLYVHRSANEAVNQARVSAIQDMVSTYYSNRGAVDVRLSDRLPQSISAAQSQAITEGRIAGAPPATIPVGAAESVSAAVGQN